MSTILIYEHPDNLFTLIISKAYLVVIVGILYLTLIYVAGATFPKKIYRRIEISAYILIIANAIAISFLRLDIVSGDDYIYTEGPAALFSYASSVFVVVVISITAIVFRDKMNRDRSKLVILWMAIWIIFAIVQYFFPKVLIISFAVCLGLITIFIKFEDLEGEIDKRSGLFNFYSYLNYVADLKRLGKKAGLVYLRPMDSILLIDDKTAETGRRQLNARLEKLKDVISFTYENRYLLVFDDGNQMKVTKLLLKARRDIYFAGKYYESFYFDDVTKLNDQNDINSIISYSKEKLKNENKPMHIITDEMMKDYYSIGIVEKLIDDCIASDRVLVYLQPIYSTKEKRFVSAEALCRLLDENGNIIPPSSFISIAEKNGMINKLDEIVFDKVCKFIAKNDMDELGLKYIETNLSVVQLSDYELADNYLEIIERNKIDTKYINLEITETAGIEQINSLMDNLQMLKSNGISLSLDDYGTGYSNLNYVVSMPVQIIKFDKKMTDEYFAGSKAKFVMDYSIRMFKAMDLKIVSEGVETKLQLDSLVELGVDYIQGYYFSKPLPMDEFIEFIKSKKNEEV
jgi:EAL domain-containing protein (putative c-di-GMP-specific phosphodiesterase class I)